MRYIVDGHNLIAAMPDIDLDDPHDEVKLVYRLRGFAIRTQKKITVVFDGGIPGGVSKSLTTSGVKVVFAAANRLTADQVIMRLLRKASNPQQVTLVSSDREVKAVAQQQRISALSAQEFIPILDPPDTSLPLPEKDDNPHISPEEVEAWLKIFSDDTDQ